MRDERGVLFAELLAPPMNLLGPELVRDLVSLIQRAEADETAQVLVFKSGDPDYFISHVDVTRIKEYPAQAAKLTGEASIALLFRHLSASRLVTIAQIEGRVRAAGSEFVLACDMRFAARESAIFAQSRRSRAYFVSTLRRARAQPARDHAAVRARPRAWPGAWSGAQLANGIIAGISGMRWTRFLIFNAIGAALWVAVWTSVGYFSGSHINTIYDDATRYDKYLVIAVLLIVAAYVTRRVMRVRRARAPDAS